jgi:hypothetical protein
MRIFNMTRFLIRREFLFLVYFRGNGKKMKKRGICIKHLLLLAGVQLMAISLMAGCGSSRKENTPQIKFAVVDSLLGPVFDVPNTGKSFKTPIGFVAMPDSQLKIFQAQIKQAVGDSEGIELQQFYVDSVAGAWLMISSIRGLNLSSDTVIFLDKYRKAVYEAFGQPNVKTEDYWIDDILAKTFLITDSLNVKLQLLCLSKDNNALELAYFTSRQAYQQLAKSFESSISSIKLTGQL